MAATRSAQENAAHAVIAGCVAVSLVGTVAVTAWALTGASSFVAGQIAIALPVVFAASTAIRGFGGLLVRRREMSAPATVGVDVGIVVLVILFVGIVSSITAGAYAQYSTLIAAFFVVPGSAVLFAIVEIVRRIVWLIRGAVVLSGVLAIGCLIVYSLSLTPQPAP